MGMLVLGGRRALSTPPAVFVSLYPPAFAGATPPARPRGPPARLQGRGGPRACPAAAGPPGAALVRRRGYSRDGRCQSTSPLAQTVNRNPIRPSTPSASPAWNSD